MPVIPRFDGVPADRRTPEQIAEQRAATTAQMQEWVRQLRAEAGVLPLLAADNATLAQRRAGQPVPQFVEDRGALVITDRVVVPARMAPILDAVSGAHDSGVTWIPGVDDFCVIKSAALGRARVANEATPADDELPGQPLHMFPMGGIRKAAGGPGLSGPGEGRWERPAPLPSGPRVAVLDSGITDQGRQDGWLSGLVTADNVDQLDRFAPFDCLDLGAGHGTFVTGVIQQVAPDADVTVLRVLESEGLGDEAVLAAAIVEAARSGAQIVNLSLGTVTADDRPPQLLQAALRAAITIRPEILFVCAAGNYAGTRPCWPAAFAAVDGFRDNVVAVAGLRLDDTAEGTETGFVGAEWSSRGDWVSCSVPGEGVVSTYVEGTETEQPPAKPETFRENPWATWSGTSFAAPQMVGAIVHTMQGDGWTGPPIKAFRKIITSTRSIEDYGPSIEILPI